ncbi:MAG: hypothetical protein AAF206_28095 [Bacteroidota bacterium]
MEDLHFDLIEDYLDGLLPEAERLKIEERVRLEPQFAQQLEKHRAARRLLSAGASQRLKAIMSQPIQSEKTLSRPLWMRIGLVAAIILLLLIPFTQFWQHRSSNILDQYTPTFTPSQLRSAQNDKPTDLEKALKAWGDGEKETAAEILQGISPEASSYVEGQYVLGHICLAEKRFEAAVLSFRVVVESKDLRYRRDAEWRLALAQLQAGNEEEAEEILDKIAADTTSAYQRRAQQLLADWNSFWHQFD